MKNLLLDCLSFFGTTLLARSPMGPYSEEKEETAGEYNSLGKILEEKKGAPAVLLPLHEKRLEQAIKRSRNYLLSEQDHQEGFWIAELEANTTLTSEYIMFRRYMGILDKAKERKAVHSLMATQQQDGGWNIYYGGSSDLSTTIEAYFAMKLAGVSKEEPCMAKAREFILRNGGVLKSRVFTRIFLALFGEYPWSALPAMPVEMVLLPNSAYINIYELSSWSRSVIVPLLIVYAKKPVVPINESARVPELYVEPEGERDYSTPFDGYSLSWKNFFIAFDKIIKIAGKFPWKPLRGKALKEAEKWILQHQDKSGDWGGIIPAMMNSIIALKCLGYDQSSPIIKKGFQAIENFRIETTDTLSLQSCISPVWDTAITMNALLESGMPSDNPDLIKAGEWLLEKQVNVRGDWRIKNPNAEPGGWAFEFVNEHYPDNDDTAEVLRALNRISFPDQEKAKKEIDRGFRWLMSMQSKNGGWGAFDKDNTKKILNEIPFADLESLLDPPTSDVTARILWMLGDLSYGKEYPPANAAISFLKRNQEYDGAWYGRWGVNYVYGTFLALVGLESIGEDMNQGYIQKAVNWLKVHQNADGGWGETCESYRDPGLRGKGNSTASQTAWAILGLLAAGEGDSSFVRRGVDYLLKTQNEDGAWDENEYTGTGFPKYFFIKYHMYRNNFPLLALSTYRGLAKNLI
ncbi:MAG: squalene--hopene cyclase [Nitrospinae bacterium]|nr:squalene--hopene cyclase [Nitrospinota bacterium]